MEANNGTAFDIIGEVEGVEANNGIAVDAGGRVEAVEAKDDTAVDTVEREEGAEYAPMALSGDTEATFPADPLPIAPAQNLEGFGMKSCCIVPRHWFDG